MSDLLAIGRSALQVNSRALEIVGSNVANAENPDYVRRSLNVGDTTIYGSTNPIYGNYTGAGGVVVNGIVRASDQFLEAATRQTGANNMANSNTVGFKADMVSAEARYLNGPGHDSRAMSVERDMQADMNAGSVTQTGRPLDIALEGDAMIAVQAADGKEAYSRRGDLRIAASGAMVTGDGFPVLGEGGPVTVPPSERVDIGADGTIFFVPQGGDPTQPQELGKLKLVSTTGSAISKGFDTLFHVPDNGQLPVDENARVISGALEESNVNMTAALVDMIETSRAWETQAKLLKSAEELDESSASIMNLPQ